MGQQKRKQQRKANGQGQQGNAAKSSGSSARPSSSTGLIVVAALVAAAAVGGYFFMSQVVSSGFGEEDLIRTVLENHGIVDESRRHVSKLSDRPRLAYVTPWNNKGYDVAKHFRGKFTHVSPVWLQLKRIAPNAYDVTGQHDIDAGWMAEVRAPVQTSSTSSSGGRSGHRVKMVPRIIVDSFTQTDFAAFLTQEEEQQAAIQTMLTVLESNDMDGMSLELWSRLQVSGAVRPALTTFIKRLGDTLHRKDKELILVVPPYQESFGAQDLAALANSVDLFSINSYDFSNAMSPGPNAPIQWIKSVVENLKPTADTRPKLLLGLNFYGNRYGGGYGEPIINQQYLHLVETAPEQLEVKWDKKAKEHVLQLLTPQGLQRVYYPTPRSIAERVQLAEELGVGICIWEIGQGLDFFMNEI